MSLTPSQLEDFLERLLAAPELWRGHVRQAGEERVSELIWEDEEVNAWLICWSEDHDTGFHDHDTSAAAIRVIDGQVREDRLRLADSPESRVIDPGHTAHVPASAIHRVLHHGSRPAVTLHAYSPPLRRMGAYRLAAGGELERISKSCEEELRPEPAGVS